MTLLDDYEAPYKLRGIKIVSDMLERVPVDILRRTGIDGLLFTVGLIPCPDFPTLTNIQTPVFVDIADKSTQSPHSLHPPHCDPHRPRPHRCIHTTWLASALRQTLRVARRRHHWKCVDLRFDRGRECSGYFGGAT